jgi:serine O-acetyltransferase
VCGHFGASEQREGIMLATLRRDIRAIFEKDPAARSIWEVLSYPGLHAIFWHRVAHAMWRAGVKTPARWLSNVSRLLTGIEIHPGAVIGPGFFIDHGMGTVIGETAEIGEDVLLYHGVTLGGSSLKKTKRHPTLGSHVVVSAGAKILGPIEIGDHVKVGPNAVVRNSVPPNSVVVGIPGRVIRENGKRVHDSTLLDHGAGLDPEGEMHRSLLRKVADLERRLAFIEGPDSPQRDRELLAADIPETPLD